VLACKKRQSELAEKRAGQLVENQKQAAEVLECQLEDIVNDWLKRKLKRKDGERPATCYRDT